MWSSVSGFLPLASCFQDSPSSSTYQYFILVNSQIIFHCMNAHLFIYPLISRWILGFHFLTILSNAAMNVFRGYMSSISFFMKTTIFGKERSVRCFMPVNGKGFTGRSVREQGKWEQPELGPRGDATGGLPRRPCPAGTARPAAGCLWASSTCR